MHPCVLVVLFDLALGEPPNRFHPTVWMGNFVSFLERSLYVNGAKWRARFHGALLVLLAVLAIGLLAGVIEYAVFRFLPSPIAWLALAAMASLAIACRSLAGHAMPVLRSLCAFRTAEARRSVSMIVGRDTEKLGRREIARAGIEAVAESLGDGIIAPLFWFALLGLPGIFIYRISNTMDSMVGHKDARYLHFGWAAARFDDLLNYIPSRILAVPSIFLATLCVKGFKSASCAVSATLHCHAAHKSPNAGWYEAAFAGALGIRLGGTNYYEGERCDYPLMNASGRCPSPRNLKDSVRIMLLSALLSSFLLDGCVIGIIIVLKGI